IEMQLTKPQAFPPCYASLLRIRNGGPGTTSGMAGIGDSRLPLISKQFDISKISQERIFGLVVYPNYMMKKDHTRKSEREKLSVSWVKDNDTDA
ncbi:hypothetical protein Tco_1390952, partial [Tanacetum coccineum]